MSFQDYSRIFKSSLLSVQLHGAGLPCDHVASSSEDEMNLNAQNAISKKRRLSVQQVRCLETSFEEESKLEPERKMQLAADLGLQPRQVAVWFQNRRARWKTKQLERDFDKLKQNYEALLFEKNELEHQVAKLKQGLQNLQSHKREDYQNSTSLVTDKIEAKLENVQKTTTAPSDEFHSMSPGFSSEADSNVERTLSSGSADGPYQYDDKQLHSLCADAPYLSNFNMFDYLIMEHHETDWLAAFH